MKNTSKVIAALLFVSVFNAYAVDLVSGDNSNLTAMCIAAATSDEHVDAKAKEFGFSSQELESFTCNGMTLKEFAKEYRDDTSGTPVVVYTFEETVSSRETQLCIAAAKSNEEYEKVKKDLFNGNVDSVACNGLSLERFAKRYGNRGFKI
ncbi:hypothetical protein D210916BOD24_17450 [Alteromonas sp. D210916BOD_24]|uniref:hypothetical protein n=1 Tax=Alteromonas sp. D210916BOD_24 TaxID=3157618 RepID=UPI00399CB90C